MNQNYFTKVRMFFCFCPNAFQFPLYWQSVGAWKLALEFNIWNGELKGTLRFVPCISLYPNQNCKFSSSKFLLFLKSVDNQMLHGSIFRLPHSSLNVYFIRCTNIFSYSSPWITSEKYEGLKNTSSKTLFSVPIRKLGSRAVPFILSL